MILILTIGLATGCVYALIAVGYSLEYRTTGIVNFSEGNYVMVGGFSTYWFYSVAHLPYPLAILGGVAVTTFCGLMLWWCVVLPLWRRRSPPYVMLLGTIVFGAILSILALLLLGPIPQTLPPWIPGFALSVGDSRIDGQYIVVVVLTLVLMAGIGATLQYTPIGREMRACAASRDTSELLGISPERVGVLSFGATAAIGGLAGAMITPAQFTSSDVGLAYGVFGFVAAVLGGFGTMRGALVGGLLLGLVNALVARYISSNYQAVIAFTMLLALLAVRPQGITGKSWEEAEA
jgi:branched-subunit amino acid ABC-type transport system permease component